MQEEEKAQVHRCRGFSPSGDCVRCSNPFRYGSILFPIYFPPGAALVAHSYPIVPIVPSTQFSSLRQVRHYSDAIIWLLQALSTSWEVGYHLSMKAYKTRYFSSLLFPLMNVNVIRGFNYLHKRKGNASGGMGEGPEGHETKYTKRMKNILKQAKRRETIEVDVRYMILFWNWDGICMDIVVHNVNFVHEGRKSCLARIVQLIPPSIPYYQVYPEFKKVLTQRYVQSIITK